MDNERKDFSLFGMLVLALVIFLVIISEMWDFLRSLMLIKITEFEKTEKKIIFRKKKKELFVLEKYDKYAVGFGKNTITFEYFGCALQGDCHNFRISQENRERLKKILTPSHLLYEGDAYRF
ncbi:MAG: hypothetical protein UR69_C0003G0041 [Candidatus Moranbacteria bacterium GW2011_GWE2_35_2-]|nr:MAG: hypothetical protein UR69_C0003G0041 [Candidatus Moranbacteria bacterium GW2011_GWE2_35_2-]KKQ22058.1 MAG: hypothetical protein US37_C0004G0017 [Candidatus Moranbacteria bacterium GW2011_GWF2_37_11]KKQ29188.1 MAG: hypothetical protein US44_C0003G0100 [Candidatus Moranbacteria bacterium GW2011_GWD1_37_17]KKQ31173.1 MAG: hypothetical protein US47_C0001G0406 [Candidatus Moranbacteria bacterium GW2011_GWE1_37_24]KKQ47423.1 MAG: hypothetical protein US66_C0012G0039 [Candidatus Moranbacteria 